MRRALVAAVCFAAIVTLAGCADAPTSSGSDASDRFVIRESEELLQITKPRSESGGTLLEGPTFDRAGFLYLVDVTAPEGETKVFRIDVDRKRVDDVYTDDVSTFTSAQIHPMDGRLYLTDFSGGTIVSMTTDGDDLQTHFQGNVEGLRALPDDLAFDSEGAMFVSDARGVLEPGWDTPGRVIRVDPDGGASVLADNLPSPNGIVFDEDEAGLWIAQYNANRIDYFGLNEDRTEILSAYPAVYVDGGRSRVDSTAVDSNGNIYQAFHGKPEVAVFNSDGDQIGSVVAPADSESSATNVAIMPGTNRGYLVVSGAEGGYVHTFEAFGEGIRQSNGG